MKAAKQIKTKICASKINFLKKFNYF